MATISLASDLIITDLVLGNGTLDVTTANYQITTATFDIYPGATFNPRNGTLVFMGGGNNDSLAFSSPSLTLWNVTVNLLDTLTIYGSYSSLSGNILTHSQQVLYQNITTINWFEQIGNIINNDFVPTQLVVSSSFINTHLQFVANDIFTISNLEISSPFNNTYATKGTHNIVSDLVVSASFIDIHAQIYDNMFHPSSLNVSGNFTNTIIIPPPALGVLAIGGSFNNTNTNSPHLFNASTLTIAGHFLRVNKNNFSPTQLIIGATFTNNIEPNPIPFHPSDLAISSTFTNTWTTHWVNE
jgi:hypothetical protein